MITGIVAEYQSEAESTKDTPYLAQSGELWGVFCEYLWENWPRYSSTTLYFEPEMYWNIKIIKSIKVLKFFQIFKLPFCKLMTGNLVDTRQFIVARGNQACSYALSLVACYTMKYVEKSTLSRNYVFFFFFFICVSIFLQKHWQWHHK